MQDDKTKTPVLEHWGFLFPILVMAGLRAIG